MQMLLTVLSFMYDHRADIKELVLKIEGLVGDAPGASKAGIARDWIASAMGIESQMEAVWPMVQPIFNLFVGLVKKPTV